MRIFQSSLLLYRYIRLFLFVALCWWVYYHFDLNKIISEINSIASSVGPQLINKLQGK